MNNLKNIVAGSLFSVAILTGGVVANAQQSTQQTQGAATAEKHDGGFGNRDFGRGKRGGFGGERGFAALNLTDAQKQQIEQIRNRFRESTQTQREQLRAAHEAEQTATENNAFNESAIRAAAQASNNARVELAVAEAKMRFETFNVLTAEQKAQIEQFKQQREQRREQFKSRRQAVQQPIS